MSEGKMSEGKKSETGRETRQDEIVRQLHGWCQPNGLLNAIGWSSKPAEVLWRGGKKKGQTYTLLQECVAPPAADGFG